MRILRTVVLSIGLAAFASACGGSDKKAEEPSGNTEMEKGEEMPAEGEGEMKEGEGTEGEGTEGEGAEGEGTEGEGGAAEGGDEGGGW